MRKVIFSILIALAPLSAAAQTALLPLEVKSEPEVVELRFAKENMVKSQATERNYRIQTALFGPEPESGYPVLFVLDGDAYFSTVASFAQGLANSPAKDTTMSLLIVGVGYSADNLLDIKQRSLDYTPPLREDATDEERSKYGQGDRFYQFLNQELMDYLATQYTLDLSQGIHLGRFTDSMSCCTKTPSLLILFYQARRFGGTISVFLILWTAGSKLRISMYVLQSESWRPWQLAMILDDVVVI